MHRHTHAHTHTGLTSETHAHAHTAIVYYGSLQRPAARKKPKKRATEPTGKKKMMHAYGLKSTPMAQGLVKDINAKHACGPNSYTNSSRDGMK